MFTEGQFVTVKEWATKDRSYLGEVFKVNHHEDPFLAVFRIGVPSRHISATTLAIDLREASVIQITDDYVRAMGIDPETGKAIAE